MGNRNTTFNKINLYVGFMGSLCSIISIAVGVCSYLNNKNIPSFLLEFIIKYGPYISLICCVLCFIVNTFFIPKYKEDIQDIPKEEARPSHVLNAILLVAICVNLVYIITSPYSPIAQEPPNNEKPQVPPIGGIEDDNPNKPYQDSGEINTSPEEQPYDKSVDKWVPITYEEVVPIETWRGLSDKELYYIRNGIFAYAHAIFESNYYERFSWYNGTINVKEFEWSYFNPYQKENIENIKAVEAERGLYQQ